jgi:hypothetical protein
MSVTIVVVLCHEDIWGSGGIAAPFLTSAVDGGKLSALLSGRFTPGNHWTARWAGPGPDSMENRRVSRPNIILSYIFHAWAFKLGVIGIRLT